MFLGLSLNHAQQMIIKGTAILGVWSLDDRNDVVPNIFWKPKLCSPASLVCCRVLLPDVWSSNSHSLNPEQYYLLLELDVGLHLRLRLFRKINGGIINASDHSKNHVLGIWFSSISLLLVGTEQVNSCSVSSPFNPGSYFAYLKKNQSKLVRLEGDDWFAQKLCSADFLIVLHVKNWPFLILYEKYRISSCTTSLIRNSDFRLPGNGPDWFAGIVVIFPPKCHVTHKCY